MSAPPDRRSGGPAGTGRGTPRPGLAGLLSAPGGSLLLLRAFLGVTFTFAGLQKLANPGFFRAGAPGSFEQQLRGAMLTSPLHGLLQLPAHAPTLFAGVIALGEVAVGLGTLAGLLARVAALGGMLLSFSFFLTISWNASPYYYGADIVFLFAWTPLVLAGAGTLSLDGLLARGHGAAPARLVPVGDHSPGGARLSRRAALGKGAAIGGLAAVAVLLAGVDALVGRLLSGPSRDTAATGTLGGAGSTSSGSTSAGAAPPGGSATTAPAPGSTTTSEAPAGTAPKGHLLGPASRVPVGGAASFTDPAQGVPAFAVQPKQGTFLAFSAVCTHAGCTVQFDQQQETFVCPCHGSVFSAATGAVLEGPAPRPLPGIPIALGPRDELYVDG